MAAETGNHVYKHQLLIPEIKATLFNFKLSFILKRTICLLATKPLTMSTTNTSFANSQTGVSKNQNPVHTSGRQTLMEKPMTRYPSQSLHFLRDLQSQEFRTGSTSSLSHLLTSASCKLHVVIVGAGLGGLSAAIALARKGHFVKILERTPELGEV